MKTTTYLFLLITFLLTSCLSNIGNDYRSEWDDSPDGVWTGPGLWANRLQDWKVENGKLMCINTKPMRTVQLTTFRIGDNAGSVNSSVKISTLDGEMASPTSSSGMLIGAGQGLDYRTASLIHHSSGPLAGLFVGLDGEGKLFIRDFEQENEYIIYSDSDSKSWNSANLILSIKTGSEYCTLTAMAVDPISNSIIDKIKDIKIPADRIPGNVALVSHSGYSENPETTFFFEKWRVSGSRFESFPDNNIGPIMGLQYTLSRNVLKMTIQMAPIGESEERSINLQLLRDGEWRDVAESEIEDYSFTARIKINDWNEDSDIPFRVVYTLSRHRKIEFMEEGIIKHDPTDKESIVTLSLSCVEQVVKARRNSWAGIDAGVYPWDWGVLYPHTQLVNNLKDHSPDFLYFAGDQVYEGASPTGADTGPLAHLDYLYKWYLWCQTYKEMTLVTPSVTIPDDHDVYHGNIWGAGGIATPPGTRGAEAQDAGGYKMSPQFVNMVHETQTSHLPDPYDPTPVEQGIKVYYTECNIGGVSFAIIEDRKFKSAPKSMLPEADIYNGWPRNPDWNAKRDSRIEATLLGERQLDFLEEWAGDWSNGTWMKAVLSQTLFANLATIPREAMTDAIVPTMEIPDSGSYINSDKTVSDFDSNGWPQEGRDRALRKFRKAFATHIVGDQHLGSTLQYGIDTWRDAGFVIVSPATGNIWPRRWQPPVPGKNPQPDWPQILGDFEDGFGNKISVHGVANPHKSTIHPTRHHELSTGYSVITFNKTSRNIELANWPYYAGPNSGEPFPFWPVTINQSDNYGRKAVAWLPEIVIEGLENAVIRIIRESTGEVVYTLRIAGDRYQPKVFFFGNYTIEVGEPDNDNWQRLQAINATSFKNRQAITLSF